MRLFPCLVATTGIFPKLLITFFLRVRMLKRIPTFASGIQQVSVNGLNFLFMLVDSLSLFTFSCDILISKCFLCLYQF